MSRALIALLGLGCAPENPHPAAPVDLRCGSTAFMDGELAVAWRGRVSVADGGLDVALAREHLHPIDAIGDVPPGSIEVTVPAAWSEEEVSLVGEATLGADTTELVCFPAASFPLTYEYDGEGACRDARGREGRAVVPMAFVRESAQGMCVDFDGVALNEGDPRDFEWYAPDLRGANLDGASLNSGLIRNAMLGGTLITGLDFEGGHLNGQVDEHTVFPTPECVMMEGEIDCPGA